MLTCRECLERMKPDDPHIRSGRYNLCGCDYCDKPTYYRDLESDNSPQVVEHIHRRSDMGKKEFDLLQYTVVKVAYLEKRLNERKPTKQTTKFTIRP